MKQNTFAIVGLGLLGGSLGGALRKAFPKANIIGVSRSASKVSVARKMGLITEGTTKLQAAARKADVIVICTPVDTIPKLISAIDNSAKSGAIVTDVGSTKGELIRWVERQKLRNIRFVGSHPMAGSHLTGIEHANPNLYQSSLVFVARHHGINKKALNQVVAMWQKLTGKVFMIDANSHDAIAAEISHLPHLIASLLVSTTSQKAMMFASSGFKDTTRVAQGDPRLWIPIFASNRTCLKHLLKRFRASLFRLEKILKTQNVHMLGHFLKKASVRRQKIT